MNRQSNIELLRIVCMFLIIGGHFSAHSGFEFPREMISCEQLWSQFLGIGGLLGVNLFVLISGYFMVKQETISISKALKLWLQIEFYSVVIYLLSVLFGQNILSIKQIIWNGFPLIFEKWWFASTYFVLFLFSPYINKLLCRLSKEEYKRLLVLLILSWSVIPTVTGKAFQGNNLLWFVTVYTLAGYFRLHGAFIEKHKKYWKYIAVGCYAMIFLSIVSLDYVRMRLVTFDLQADYFAKMQAVTLLALAVSIFLTFNVMKIQHNRMINSIAATVFGIYLIHDHPVVREYIWKNCFAFIKNLDGMLFIAWSLFAIVIVFVTSGAMEFIRALLVERLYLPALKSLNDRK